MSSVYPRGPVASMMYAVQGIVEAWRIGLYFRIGVGMAVLVFLLALFLRVSKQDFIIILILIGTVLAAELFNTVIEKICDVTRPAHDERIAQIKDMSAGAVLVVGITAAVAGLVVFVPYLV